MKPLLVTIKDSIGKDDDFFMIDQQFNEIDVVLVGLKSLIDLQKSIQFIEENVLTGATKNKRILQKLNTIG